MPAQQIFNDDNLEAARRIVSEMTLKAKIAQLIFISAWSNRDEAYENALIDRVQQHEYGGIIFFQGTPERQATITAKIQQALKIPAMISMDAEWGLSMRLDNAPGFPYAMSLAAIQDHELIYDTAALMARQLKSLGVSMNFAPVADVNNNPANPVISFRSFGEDPQWVAKNCTAFIRGLQDHKVLAVSKHFPGHGDTSVDSHLDLPVINKTVQELEQNEWVPFRENIKQGIGGIMTGHLYLPELVNEKVPATASRDITSGILSNKMGFEGLIITDALDMKGIANMYAPGAIELKCLEAGNDILLFPQDAEVAIDHISKAVDSGHINEAAIDDKCLKVLQAKIWAGELDINRYEPDNQLEVHLDEYMALNARLAEKSVTLLKNDYKIPGEGQYLYADLDIRYTGGAYGALAHHQISKAQDDLASLPPLNEALQQQLAGNTHQQAWITREMLEDNPQEKLKDFEAYGLKIFHLHGASIKPVENFGLDALWIDFIKKCARLPNAVFVISANPYLLTTLPELLDCSGLILAYQESQFAYGAIAKILARKLSPAGKLPITISNNMPRGYGLTF